MTTASDVNGKINMMAHLDPSSGTGIHAPVAEVSQARISVDLSAARTLPHQDFRDYQWPMPG